MLTRHQAAEMLASFDRVLILCHRNPDGDTLGSGFALCRAFLNQGKKARVFCNDPIPEKFSYMIPEQQEDFVPLHVVSVDVADPALLGPNTEQMIAPYSPIELSVDHHPTHKQFAQELFLEADSASCCEIVRELLREMGWEIDAGIANCLYTGLSTDTGCFKFSNTTPRTHRIAAEMIEMGADHTRINKVMFDTVTFNELELEQLALEKMWMSDDQKIAVLTITTDMLRQTGVSEAQLDRITALTRKISGVEVGITIKQRGEVDYKVSVRTAETISASKICEHFGGGGHARAAGCQFDLSDPIVIREKLVEAVYKTAEEERCAGQ